MFWIAELKGLVVKDSIVFTLADAQELLDVVSNIAIPMKYAGVVLQPIQQWLQSRFADSQVGKGEDLSTPSP